MKTFSTLIIILALAHTVKAQQINNKTTFRSSAKSSFTVPCNPNSFWLNYEDSTNWGQFNICEYTLINNTIAQSNLDLKDVLNASVGYCYDFNAPPNYTLYNLDTYITNSILKYTGSNWTHIPNAYNQFTFANCGGFDSILYFTAKDSASLYLDFVFKFKSTNLVNIFHTDSDEVISVADIAVQNDYSFFIFISKYNTFSAPYKLLRIDQYGNILNTYHILSTTGFENTNAYGIFIMDNILYVGIGWGNPLHSNTLIPFTIVNDTAVMGTPIPFTGPPNRFDLESCNQGTLTSVKEVPEEYKQLSLYPNPAQDQFTVYVPYGVPQNAMLQVYSITGELIEEKYIYELRGPISCQNWVKGVYVVTIQVPNSVGYRTKFVKM